MPDRSNDDLNQTTPSIEDDKSSEQPGTRATEEIRNREDIEEDENINDRFQATDN
jgi:hypothetical protein